MDAAVNPFMFWDHGFGDNTTVDGAGTRATDPVSYAALRSSFNLAQNSWNIEFFNNSPFDGFDPNAEGIYTIYLAAFDPMTGSEIARTTINVETVRPLEYDQNVTNAAIFGSGNINGGFTTDRADGFELGIRGKVRFPVPQNVFNSNGDGTYVFRTGPGNPPATEPVWAFDWSLNSDYDGSASGRKIDGLTYEMGLDFDPGTGTSYLVFDPVAAPSVFPFTTPATQIFWDHSIGDSTTADGAGVEATNQAQYLSLIAANNLAQNSSRYGFFDEPPFSIDAIQAGRYEIYLAASDANGEIARSEISILALGQNLMTLEAAPCQTDQVPGMPGVQVKYELWARNLSQVVSGYQTFLSFDSSVMAFEPSASDYASGPFTWHITSIAAANVAARQLRLDGGVAPLAPGTDEDTLLATLVFTVPDCSTSSLSFDLGQGFLNEFSNLGTSVVTSLLNSSPVLADAAPPLFSPIADIIVPAGVNFGGGCASAVVNYPMPTVVDTCSNVSLVCTPPAGTAFPAGQTTTVTCIATDDCGNTAVQTFDVTVTSTNELSLEVELVGVTTPVSRCLRLQTDNCSAVDIVFNFVDHDANPATPVRAFGVVQIPCGTWMNLCVKDQQHTLWSTVGLTPVGTAYQGSSLVQLQGGDTDNDGDVDINDVTLFLAQFGDPASPGGCAWNGTRDADFDNNGFVGSSDYTFLTANWLTRTSCGCTSPSTIGGRPVFTESEHVARVVTATQRLADLNKDGWIDARDVAIFEAKNRLDGSLSAAMRARAAGVALPDAWR